MKKKSERATISLSLLSLISFFVFLGAVTSEGFPIFNIIALVIILVFFFQLGYREK